MQESVRYVTKLPMGFLGELEFLQNNFTKRGRQSVKQIVGGNPQDSPPPFSHIYLEVE